MFGSLGYWASSKGMVTVPDLSGLTEAQASTALSNVILSYAKVANTQTSNSGLVGKVATQSVAAGGLANYEAVIQISIYELLCVPVWSEWYDIGSPYNYSVCAPNNTQTYFTQQRRDTSNCGVASETREVQKSTSCSYCATQPNYTSTVYEDEDYIYDPNCDWRYWYKITYNGCGTPIGEEFLYRELICTTPPPPVTQFTYANGAPPSLPPGATSLSSGSLFLLNGQSQSVTTTGCGVQTVGPAWTTGGWFWLCYQP
jgi:hypothetical protein